MGVARRGLNGLLVKGWEFMYNAKLQSHFNQNDVWETEITNDISQGAPIPGVAPNADCGEARVSAAHAPRRRGRKGRPELLGRDNTTGSNLHPVPKFWDQAFSGTAAMEMLWSECHLQEPIGEA